MSKILVDTIDTRSGTSTLTLGSSNAGTIALGSGDVQSNFLYPAFLAYLSSNQTVSNNTVTKISCDTESLDTNSNYDTSNYRFTPTVAGKYFIYGATQTSTDASALSFAQAIIYKNGAYASENTIDFRGGSGGASNIVFTSVIADLNGSSDYVELFGRINSSSNHSFQGGSFPINYFGGYRIGS